MLSLGLLPAKGYASHGESWSFALALKLGSFSLLRADGVEPVLVLDDVFAELDTTRRERLATGVSAAEQVLVTAAVGADVPEQLSGRRFTVADGAGGRRMSDDPPTHEPRPGRSGQLPPPTTRRALDLARTIARSVARRGPPSACQHRDATLAADPQVSGARADDRDPKLLSGDGG